MGFELAADVGEVHSEVVGFVAVVRAPHFFEELAPGDELAGVADEDFDEMPFGWRETDLASAVTYGINAFALSFAADEPREGMRAFLEKRPPAFASASASAGGGT